MDKYDEAIEYLTTQTTRRVAPLTTYYMGPNTSMEISQAWHTPHVARGGCLFQYATPTGKGHPEDAVIAGMADVDRLYVGCLTMVHRSMHCHAATPELTAAIRADTRIPTTIYQFSREELEVFAEWQRFMDVLWDRDPVNQTIVEREKLNIHQDEPMVCEPSV